MFSFANILGHIRSVGLSQPKREFRLIRFSYVGPALCSSSGIRRTKTTRQSRILLSGHQGPSYERLVLVHFCLRPAHGQI